MSHSINTENADASIKYGNLAAKLANVFIQQVTLMQKLKGNSQQKVVFENVHIHNGVQAMVSAINTTICPIQEKYENNPIHRQINENICFY